MPPAGATACAIREAIPDAVLAAIAFGTAGAKSNVETNEPRSIAAAHSAH